VLDSEHPVRVFEGDELVGVVDDEEILRVVVAEDELVETPDEGHPVPVAVEQGGVAQGVGQ
jgi:glycine betaine/proline transport system ATP-binding protein